MKRTLMQFGIPIFFYISGQASSFYNTEKHGFAKFFRSKVLRLFLPFFVGLFIFVTPTHYLLQDIDTDSELPDGQVEP